MFPLSFVEKIKSRVDRFYDCVGKGVVVIWGATATGKTGLSVQLSDHYPISVVSSDSRQIFRYMDIGTDKVSKKVRDQIPHYQIDIIDPNEHYTAGQWKKDAVSCIDTILLQGGRPFVVGGTGLYIDTIYKNFSMPDVEPDYDLRDKLYAKNEKDPGVLWKDLQTIDPDEANIHHPNSVRYIVRALEIYYKTGKNKTSYMQRNRPYWPLLMLGLWRDKEDTNKKINLRVKEMLMDGLIDETQWLLDQGYTSDLQSMQGIGYKQTVDYLLDHGDSERLEMEIKRTTHRLAKKQRSWFRRYRADQIQGFPDVEYDVFDLS